MPVLPSNDALNVPASIDDVHFFYSIIFSYPIYLGDFGGVFEFDDISEKSMVDKINRMSESDIANWDRVGGSVYAADRDGLQLLLDQCRHDRGLRQADIYDQQKIFRVRLSGGEVVTKRELESWRADMWARYSVAPVS